MKREFLSNLGIEKDIIDKIMSETGKDIETNKTASAALEADKVTLTASVTKLQGDIVERDKQIVTIKGETGDNAALNKIIEDMVKTNKTAKAGHDAVIKNMAFDHKLDTSIAGLKPRNVKALKALLDVGKISIDNDNLIGFDDQIAKIKESDGYLFEDEADPGSGGNPANPKDIEGELTIAEKNAIWGGYAPK